ncbi:hypothetical protein A1D31_22150 [Bradyrhizobium liaoningense]|nr:hypothetical protein A1D31_22150 [Bradyrhizobium liaoningense]
MTTSKKIHPADAADLALIPACKKFTANILKGGKQQTSEFDSLTSARLEAVKLNATSNNGRKALVYAITDDGRSILVPASYGKGIDSPELEAAKKAVAAKASKPISGKPSEADLAAAKEEAAERAAKKAKPAKQAKPAKKAKAAKPAKKPKAEGKSKVDIVIKMLTGAKAVTRKDIAEAVEWPSINIKAICARKGMKLKHEKDGTLSATAPKA